MAESQVTFTITGDDVGRDPDRITDQLEEADGIMGAAVDPDSGEVEVRFDADLISEERARQAVSDLGLEVA